MHFYIDWRFKFWTEETFVRDIIKLQKFTILFKCIGHFERVSEWLLLSANSPILQQEQVNFQWDDDKVRFVLDQHA
jgi:hypothetical protein